MNGIYRSQRHVYDLTRRYYLLGRVHLIKELNAYPGEKIVEVGCGTAWNLIRIARHYPDLALHGFDISSEMLTTARAKIRKARVAASLAHGDASHFDVKAMFGIDAADHIVMSYTISMIPLWREAIDQALQALGPNGKLHIVDFGQCEGMPSGCKKLLEWWLRQFSVTPRAGLIRELEVQGGANFTMNHRSIYRGYACHAVLTKN